MFVPSVDVKTSKCWVEKMKMCHFIYETAPESSSDETSFKSTEKLVHGTKYQVSIHVKRTVQVTKLSIFPPDSYIP